MGNAKTPTPGQQVDAAINDLRDRGISFFQIRVTPDDVVHVDINDPDEVRRQLDRYNEAIASDVVIPFRVMT